MACDVSSIGASGALQVYRFGISKLIETVSSRYAVLGLGLSVVAVCSGLGVLCSIRSLCDMFVD